MSVKISAEPCFFAAHVCVNLVLLIIESQCWIDNFEVVGDILKVDAPITFKEAFSKGMAIPKSYTYLSLSEQPTEKYEEITFTIH